MDDLMTALKKRPDLQSIIKTLQETLAEEGRLRDEFYNTIDEDDKAEFINGEVIMHSPVKLEHAEASGFLFSLIKCYVAKHDLGSVFPEKIMVHLTRNSYEPDIVFFNNEKAKSFKTAKCFFLRLILWLKYYALPPKKMTGVLNLRTMHYTMLQNTG